MKIFIVDDDDDDRELFCEAILDLDDTIVCREMSGGEQLLKALTSEKPNPNYIFLDMNMPRMNGIQCLAELKSNDVLKDIPVIIYSTSKLPEIISNAMKAGAANYIVKPTTVAAIRESIASILHLAL